MKKRWLVLLASIMLLLGACSSTEKGSDGKLDDSVSKDNPSGDLAPLKEKVKVVIAEDGAASGAGFYIAKE